MLTVAITDDALVGILLGCCAQTGRTPLFKACARGCHVEVVMLLLAHPDVLVNLAVNVSASGWQREGAVRA